MKLEISNIATSDGWRGVLADQVTGPLVRELASKMVSYLGQVDFIVGYDTRFMSDYFAALITNTLIGLGCNCLLSHQPLATPILAWSVKQKNEINNGRDCWGIQITASHNPAHYSGIKLREPSGKAAGPRLLNRIMDASPSTLRGQPGTLEKADLITPYVDAMRQEFRDVKLPEPFTWIAVDAMHGASAGLCQAILTPENEVVALRQGHDPYFGGTPPEPKENNLKPLRDKVEREKGCLVGIAHDGDGDRLAAWMPELGYLSPHDIGCLLALNVLERGIPGALVASATTTRRIGLLADHFGRSYFETDVGFHHAADIMLETPTAIAIEENGGIAFGHHLPDRDGTYSGLCLIRALTIHQGQIDQMLTRIEAITGPNHFERRDITTKSSQSGHLEQLKNSLPDLFGEDFSGSRDLLAGFKCTLADNNWLVVRRAGTEPLFRLYGETESKSKTAEILDKLESGLNSLL